MQNGSRASNGETVPVAAGQERATRVRWLVFATGVRCFLVPFSVTRYTWNFIRPELEKEFGLNNTQLEALFSALSVSYAAGQIPSGVICDLFGDHTFLAVTIALWSLTLPFFGTAGTVYQLGGLRFTFGLAQAGCYPALSHVDASTR